MYTQLLCDIVLDWDQVLQQVFGMIGFTSESSVSFTIYNNNHRTKI